MIPRQDSDHPIDKIRFGLMVAIGGEDSSDTLELLKDQERIARRELKEVPERAEARGQEFLDYSAESRTSLLTQLESYLSWLTKAKTALEQHDSSETVKAYEASQEILPKLNAAMDGYSNDFSSFGPFKSKPANTMLRMAQGIESGEVPNAAWGQYCRYFGDGIASKVESLTNLDLPGRTFLQESYDASIDRLEELNQALPASAASVTPQIALLDVAYHRAESLENRMAKAVKGGPTNIPATNALLAILDNGVDALGQDAILSVVEDYGELMDAYTETFEEAASRPTDSALIQEEIPRTLDTLDSHYAAIEELGEAIENSEFDKLPELIARLTTTAGQLEESNEVFETAAQHQANITCPSCARPNPPENRNCEACGEILPRPEDAGATSSSTFSVLSGPALEENQQLEMTENVARLFQACDDVNDGVITPEQFANELEFASAGLKEFVEELDGLVATALDEDNFTPEQMEVWKSTHLPYLEEVAVTYQAGIEEVQQGLVTMELFLTDPNRMHLVEGIRLSWQGLSAIHRARLSMQTYLNMLEDVMQEARDEGLITGE
jgi:tetratricopeptide (TPR) repeat protein